MYIYYLDASIAFDRINNLGLFNKIIKRNIDATSIRLLTFWYCQHTFCVRWGNQFSQFLAVSNVMRQGGIMLPVF